MKPTTTERKGETKDDCSIKWGGRSSIRSLVPNFTWGSNMTYFWHESCLAARVSGAWETPLFIVKQYRRNK